MKFDRALEQQYNKLLSDLDRYGTNKPLDGDDPAARIARCEHDKAAFGELYFPHRVRRAKDGTLITPEHEELLRITDIKNVPKLILCYRYFAKSTWGTVIDTLHKICYKKFQAGIIGSYDAKTATVNFTSAVYYELKVNARLRQDFGELLGGQLNSVSDFITTSGIRLAARGVHEMVKGFNNPLTGARLDLFKGDDLQKRESARSIKQVQSLLQWLWEEVYLALAEEIDGGSYFDIAGTCVDGGMDAMSAMKNDTSRQMLKLIVPMVLDAPSVMIDTRERGTVTTRTISAANGKPQWQARYSLSRCHQIRHNVGNSIFAAEMQQRPQSAAFKIFRVKEWTQYLQPHGKIPIPDYAEHVLIGRADPSFTTHGCRKAVVLLSSDLTLRYVYVRHVFLRQCSNEEFLAAIDAIGRQYSGAVIRIEENSLKEWLWDDVQSYEERHHTHLPLTPVHVFGNKDLRIRTLESPYQRGVFVFKQGHSDQDILLDEADMYPEGIFKDGVDAWSGAYSDLLDAVRSLDSDDMQNSTGDRLPIQSMPIRAVLGHIQPWRTRP